jgi:hypothetical protein
MDNELPEMPELEREIRKDKLNTVVAIIVTILVTFMAICRLNDNNLILAMQRTQTLSLDKWSWYQSISVREDITDSRLNDVHIQQKEKQEPEKKQFLDGQENYYGKFKQSLLDKKEKLKEQAKAEDEHYEKLDANHEKFDQSEALISIAVSMLALTSLLQKRWMLALALIPALFGMVEGAMGLVMIIGK